MAATPKRQGREPQEGGVFLSDVVAAAVRAERARRSWSQEQLADRMRRLGHPQWARATVSEVERSGRSVSLDEFFSLALALGLRPVDMLRPMGKRIDLGPMHPVPAPFVAMWISGRMRVEFNPDHPESLQFEWHEEPEPPAPATAEEIIRFFGDGVRYSGEGE